MPFSRPGRSSDTQISLQLALLTAKMKGTYCSRQHASSESVAVQEQQHEQRLRMNTSA
jgi:hypothetical protein